MIPTNTSKYVLRLNVSNARSGLLYHWIGLLKTRISVACTAILNIRRIGRRFSLIWLRKPFIGELTERKICYQNVGESVREVNIATHQLKDALVGHYLTAMRVFNAIIGEVQYVRN